MERKGAQWCERAKVSELEVHVYRCLWVECLIVSAARKGWYVPFGKTDGDREGGSTDKRAKRRQTDARKEDVLPVKGDMQVIFPAIHLHGVSGWGYEGMKDKREFKTPVTEL
jgi:hypothetical protein